MSRSQNLANYPLSERVMLTTEFISKLPQDLGPFATRRAAMTARLAFYGLLGAARKSGTAIEANNSWRLAITNPELRSNNADAGGSTLTDAAGNWWLTIYDRENPTAGYGETNAAFAKLTAATLGGAAGIDSAINADLQQASPAPTPTPTVQPTEPFVVDDQKLSNLLDSLGYSSSTPDTEKDTK